MQRRLAAILAADVVGYSRLMAANEAATLAALRELRRESFEPLVATHRGNVVKRMGDGWLIEFASVVDAVNCAIAVQERLAGHDIVKLRVGIHIGDIVHEDEDIYGDGVNIASRLQEACAPGSITISDMTRRSLDQTLSERFASVGGLTLKNIAQPIDAYAWGSTADTPAATAVATQTRPSIAVLPFDNLSGDPEQAYFSDGLAEDLITDLAKIPDLSVAARHSSFAFRDHSTDLAAVGRQLGVGFILEGSLRKMGERLRINAQLIDVLTGKHAWAERYDGALSEVFDFQDRITAEIVAALQVKLAPAEHHRTDNVEAYDHYLKGRMHYFRYTPDDNLCSRKHLARAIELDPGFAEAYSYLSCCYTNAWLFLWPGFDEGLPKALDYARKGIELAPDSAIAYTRLAWVQVFMRRHDEAVADFERALALDADNAEVRAYFGETLNYCGRPQDAVGHLETALRLDPFCPPSWLFILGHAHFLLRHHDDAMTLVRQAVERLPDLLVARLFLTCLLVETGHAAEAAEQVRTILDKSPRYTIRDVDRIYPYLRDADRERFLTDLRQAGLPDG